MHIPASFLLLATLVIATGAAIASPAPGSAKMVASVPVAAIGASPVAHS